MYHNQTEGGQVRRDRERPVVATRKNPAVPRSPGWNANRRRAVAAVDDEAVVSAGDRGQSSSRGAEVRSVPGALLAVSGPVSLRPSFATPGRHGGRPGTPL